MAELDVQTVRLRRTDTGSPWGFRLQGGRDFNTPLSVQKVTEKSIAKRSGLKEGDAILFIGKTKTDSLDHEQAKMEIIRNGNELEFVVQRGGVKIWQPEVSPMSSLRPKQPNLVAPTGEAPQFQKTSLHANKPDYVPIGVAHNRAPQAFAPSASVVLPENKEIVEQVNSPASLYSAQNAAQAFTSQMEAQGLEAQVEGLSVDDKPRHHRPSLYGEEDESSSAVQSRSFRMLQQALDESEGTPNLPASRWSKEGGVNAPNPELPCPKGVTPIRPVKPPTTKPAPEKAPQQYMTCYVCGSLCTGVFVKIHGQPIHPDCFRCKVCKMNLAQKGYFWINETMFCETHAKEVAQPPASGMVPVAIN